MKTSFLKVMLVVTILLSPLDYNLLASELVHEFKNPSFSGNGYSQHVLSIDQLETQRKDKVKDDNMMEMKKEVKIVLAWKKVKLMEFLKMM